MSICLPERMDGPSWCGLPLGRFRLPPDDGQTLLVASPQHTLFVWRDGASPATVRSRGRTRQCARRDGLMDVMVAHEQTAISHHRPHSPGECLLVALPGADDEAWADELPTAAARTRLKPQFSFADARLHALAGALFAQCRDGEPHGRLYTESVSLALAGHVWRRHATGARAGATPGLGRHQRTLIESYLEAHLGSDVGLAELAALLGYSRAQFVRLFRQSFGASPHQYLMRRRVEHAKQLLRRDGESLAGIAAACGFSDASHFSNCFVRWAGTTPGRYRVQG